MMTVKMGDRVEYVAIDDNAVRHRGKCPGTIIQWQNGSSPIVKWDDGVVSKHNPLYLTPSIAPADDPLPPAPVQVMYHSDNNPDRRLDVSIGKGVLFLYARKIPQADVTVLRLDPDAALQLAHDLTRMAMQLKREQRAAEQN